MKETTMDTLRAGVAALIIGCVPVLVSGPFATFARPGTHDYLVVTTTTPTTTTTAPPTTIPPETTTTPVLETIPPPPPAQAPAPLVHYGSCEEAHQAGAAPLYRGDPGYSTNLDRDRDGVACE